MVALGSFMIFVDVWGSGGVQAMDYVLVLSIKIPNLVT